MINGTFTAKEAATLVQLVVQDIDGAAFYYLTEVLWLQLLKSQPFAKFAHLLQKCEEQLKGHVLVDRLIFYIRLLRTANWKASSKWVTAKVRFLEKHSELVPNSLQFELDFLEHLMNYKEGRDQFLNGTPMPAMFDKAFQAFCEGDELDSEKAFLELQLSIQRNPDAVLDAFPMGEDVFEPAMILFQIVAGEMESRLLEEMEFDPRSQIHGVRDMAYAQEKRSDQSAIGIVWFFFRWAVMIGDILLGLVPIFLILAFIPRMFLLILGWLVTWYYLFHKNLRQKALTWLAFHFSSLLYRYHWREAAIRISQIMFRIEDPDIQIHHLFAYYHRFV